MRKISTLLFITGIIVCKTNFVFAQVDINDSLALVDLYDSTGGPNWTNHTNWLTAAPVSTWYGTYIDNNRVIGIWMPHNNLSGEIPASIGNLTALWDISFSYNNLTGKIPDSIGNIPLLDVLDLSNNN